MSRSNFEPELFRLQVKFFAFIFSANLLGSVDSERSQLQSRTQKALSLVTQRCKVHVANRHMDNINRAIQQEISCITNQI